MTDRTDLLTALEPVFAAVVGLDLHSPDAAAALAQQFPLDGAVLVAVREAVDAGLRDGWLCPRESQGVRFGRPLKPTEAAHGYSVDAVDMDGPGPGHVHPNGEVDLCFAVDGAPRFDGHPPGWVVYPPGS